jgi:LysM repeat protein
MSRVFPTLLVVLGLTVMLIGVCEAGERKHTVAAGESASAIAKTYYGDFELTPLLLAFNGRAKPDLQPGETLRIPYCEVHRVKRGDSWSALSHRYLKGKSNYAVVAELNGMLPEKPLQPGDEIVFPVFLDHRLERGETLGALAERYYGQPSLGRLLQESNVLDNPRRLSVGETVQIPLLDFKLTAPVKAKKIETAQVKKPEPVQKKPEPKPPEQPAEPPVRFARELSSARELFQAGEFEESRNLLESIRGDIGSSSPAAEQAEHAGLLAFVYVAFDLSAEACEVYGSIADLPPARELDPEMVSPRIRETLSGCSSE